MSDIYDQVELDMLKNAEWFEERAAIREYDGLMPRPVAEKKAREDVSRYPKLENEGSEA